MRALRLVAVDLDGTTVRRDGSVARRTRAAIAEARRRGVLVCVATGRTYEGADAFRSRLGADGPVICCDGALTRDPAHGPVRAAETIDPAAVAAVCGATEAAGGGWAAYSDRGRILGGAPRRRPWRTLLRLGLRPALFWQHLDFERRQPLHRGPVGRDEGVYKLVVWGVDCGAMAGGWTDLPLRWPSGVGRRALEIVGAGVSKGVALAALADALGIDREAVAAFGDGRNDVEMLAYAGWGVAMGNAPEAVRAVADAVAGTVERDGFALALASRLREA